METSKDTAPRTVEVPADFAAALDAGGLRAAFDALPYSHRRKHVHDIEGAERPATRARLIQSALDLLPQRDIWTVNRTVQVDEHLDGRRDPRWVDTESARGEYSLNQLYRTLGVDLAKRRLTAPDRGYYLFCGHRGCGKSTELRRIADELHRDDRYYVVFADAAQELDVNNLRYPDVLLHLASLLTAQLADDDIRVDETYLHQLQDWFTERVEKTERTKTLALEAGAGAKATVGLPFLATVFAHISTAFKTNTTHKEELRRTLRNSFTDFSEGFNQLIEAAEDQIDRRLLFVVDGTDRLGGEDAQAFFVADVHQLQQVHGMFVYCAPVHLAYEGNDIGQNFTSIFRLPMIKVANSDGSPQDNGYTAMREILHRRAAPELFDCGVADLLIEYSGGHPRDLLRLLLNAFKHAEHDRFDDASSRQAVREMATDFQRILSPEDYRMLATIDANLPRPSGFEERVRDLLYDLALLEYNDFYWRSHPVIRTLPAYEAARNAVTNE